MWCLFISIPLNTKDGTLTSRRTMFEVGDDDRLRVGCVHIGTCARVGKVQSTHRQTEIVTIVRHARARIIRLATHDRCCTQTHPVFKFKKYVSLTKCNDR
jgi:hypothetical protein